VVVEPGEPLNPYVDPAGNFHTNFKLDGDGEYLALTYQDGATMAIAHEYAPQYPDQTSDISFGLSDLGTTWDTLVSAGDPASYHVPTAGEDVLAWTAPDYDDSAWIDTFTIDPSGLLITEISTGDPRFVEIQNVSAEPIDTAGWSVLVNDASAGQINDVASAAWSLPGSIAPAEVLYRTDNPADNYWGSPIPWDAEGPGWVMIVDDTGDVQDFVAWGYSLAEIASLEVDFGPLTNITLGDQWSGDGAKMGVVVPEGAAESTFVAFNDHVPDPVLTHPNATSYALDSGNPDRWESSGRMKNIVTGEDTRVTLTITQQGVRYAGTQGAPYPGTDAYAIFNGYVDFTSGTGASLEIEDSDYYRHTFSGLDTGNAVTYNFAGTAVRGSPTYHNRWTLVTLEGAESATAAHSTGVGVVVVSPTEVAIWTGFNDDPGQGFVAAWTEIDPGPDGEFSIVSREYFGPTPGVGDGEAGGDKGYAISGLRLEEVSPPGSLLWLTRTGNTDHGSADDFVRTIESSLGVQNPEMTVPFGSVLDVTTGIGFSDSQPQFDAAIQTDVSDAMQGVNASLWSRIEFDVPNMSQFDELTLRMKYDDGFAAYLNGVPIADRNAPTQLAYNSAATDTHPDEQAVVFEEIDVTDHLWFALREGTNVLAIHGLNTSAGDGDFLILPELIATSHLDDPQYMTTPTPRNTNVPGTLGWVKDTNFSVDRGFYSEAFDVEITTDTPGAEIRYTLDGSKPSETVGQLYDGPITIDTTTMLRAVAYKTGYTSTNVDTQTYIFPEQVAAQTRPADYPASWGNAPDVDYDVDPQIVNDPAYRDQFLEGLTSIPTLSLVLPVDDIFGSGGLYSNPGSTSLEKETSAEFIFPDTGESVQIDAGLKMQGGASRNPNKAPKHSMSLRFRAAYGPGRFEFPLFDDWPVDRFNSLQLRAMYNNSWIHWDSGQRRRGSMIRDQWARDGRATR